MPEIQVIRDVPPSLARCHHATCRGAIEFVRTVPRDRRMPLDHPVKVEREHVREDGTRITIVDAGASHFATCPAAAEFRRGRSSKAPR